VRRRHAEAEAPPPAALPPVVIDPHTIYMLPAFRVAFALRESTVRREVREGRLRIAKRAGRYYLLGEWILEWLKSGEVRRRTAERNGTTPAAGTEAPTPRHS
jgi:hypothetical protein